MNTFVHPRKKTQAGGRGEASGREPDLAALL